MKKGDIVKFVGWNDPHKDKLGIITMVNPLDIQVHIPEINERICRLRRHLELVK